MMVNGVKGFKSNTGGPAHGPVYVKFRGKLTLEKAIQTRFFLTYDRIPSRCLWVEGGRAGWVQSGTSQAVLLKINDNEFSGKNIHTVSNQILAVRNILG